MRRVRKNVDEQEFAEHIAAIAAKTRKVIVEKEKVVKATEAAAQKAIRTYRVRAWTVSVSVCAAAGLVLVLGLRKPGATDVSTAQSVPSNGSSIVAIREEPDHAFVAGVPGPGGMSPTSPLLEFNANRNSSQEVQSSKKDFTILKPVRRARVSHDSERLIDAQISALKDELASGYSIYPQIEPEMNKRQTLACLRRKLEEAKVDAAREGEKMDRILYDDPASSPNADELPQPKTPLSDQEKEEQIHRDEELDRLFPGRRRPQERVPSIFERGVLRRNQL